MSPKTKKYISIGIAVALTVTAILVFISRRKPKAKKVLAIGDSNTVASFSYVDKLRRLYPSLEIKKIAKNGANTNWMLEQLRSELKSNKYDLVIVLGGSNDVYGGLSLETTQKNMLSMNSLIKSSGARSLFISPPSKQFYTAKSESLNKKLEDLVRWMKVQEFSVFIDWNNITNVKELFSASDKYLHPQSNAHTLLAQNISKEIKFT
jgi:lysophospholipase L1-like esterase